MRSLSELFRCASMDGAILRASAEGQEEVERRTLWGREEIRRAAAGHAARQVCSGSSHRTSASKRYGCRRTGAASHPAHHVEDCLLPLKQTVRHPFESPTKLHVDRPGTQAAGARGAWTYSSRA